ncbi:hypothetical protein GCM10025871_23780 [Deinococcus metallilatus]|nr:hypothetical protein GCM10025871_23780 [Deinococcus metallilatus]
MLFGAWVGCPPRLPHVSPLAGPTLAVHRDDEGLQFPFHHTLAKLGGQSRGRQVGRLLGACRSTRL